MDVPGHGKLCFLVDPEGAPIAMWQQVGPGQGVFTSEQYTEAITVAMEREADERCAEVVRKYGLPEGTSFA